MIEMSTLINGGSVSGVCARYGLSVILFRDDYEPFIAANATITIPSCVTFMHESIPTPRFILMQKDTEGIRIERDIRHCSPNSQLDTSLEMRVRC